MAKPGRKPKPSDNGAAENVSGYFRRVFNERPDLLSGSSNSQLYDRWLKDNPGQKEVPKRVKAILFNVKSVLRKHGRKRRGARHAGQPAQGAAVSAAMPRTYVQKLEALEEQIDECLTIAKNV